jgi:hypothetical protein
VKGWHINKHEGVNFIFNAYPIKIQAAHTENCYRKQHLDWQIGSPYQSKFIKYKQSQTTWGTTMVAACCIVVDKLPKKKTQTPMA